MADTTRARSSFPGGKAEAEDVDAVATALREAEEEIGLDAVAADVRVVGLLDRLWIPVSDFAVTPVVALASRRPELVAAPAEVVRIIEPPIATFLPDAPIARRRADDPRMADPLQPLRGRRVVGVGRDGARPEPARRRHRRHRDTTGTLAGLTREPNAPFCRRGDGPKAHWWRHVGTCEPPRWIAQVPGCRTPVAPGREVAFREASGQPPTDEVHGFLDLLDRLARMDE